jgi:hypothetical protein
LSRPQRSLRKIFIIYCEGDTEYGNIYQKDIYPSIITVPVKWDYVIPYGIMYRENPPVTVERFIKEIRKALT